MTTQAEAIRELIEKIEAEELQEYYNPSQFKAVPFGQRSRAASAFMGSLDSAMALHDTLLPGWRGKEMLVNDFGDCYFELERKDDPAARGAKSKIPARAWLLAILKAYLADMEQSLDPTVPPR